MKPPLLNTCCQTNDAPTLQTAYIENRTAAGISGGLRTFQPVKEQNRGPGFQGRFHPVAARSAKRLDLSGPDRAEVLRDAFCGPIPPLQFQ